MRLLYKSIPPLKDTDGIDGGEFYGLRGDIERIMGRRKEEMEIEMYGREEITDTVIVRKNDRKRIRNMVNLKRG